MSRLVLPSGLTLRQLLTAVREGGIKDPSYWDPIGQCWTGGIGCTGPDIVEGTTRTPEAWGALFIDRCLVADEGAERDLGTSYWEGLGAVRQAVFGDVAFQLGVAGLAQFTTTLGCACAGDWRGAAAALQDSKYDKQTPFRCEENAQMLITNVWPAWLLGMSA